MGKPLDHEALHRGLTFPGSPWASVAVHPEIDSTNAEAARLGTGWTGGGGGPPPPRRRPPGPHVSRPSRDRRRRLSPRSGPRRKPRVASAPRRPRDDRGDLRGGGG